MKKNYNQPQTEFVRDCFTGAICQTPMDDPIPVSAGAGGLAPMRY